MQIQYRTSSKLLTAIIMPAKEIMDKHRSYHGRMTGAAAERVLQGMNEEVPCYLTRFSANHNKYVLSVLTEDMEGELETQDFELAINNDNNRYELLGTGKSFNNIDDLLSFYERSPLTETIQSIGVPCVASEDTRRTQEVGNKKRTTLLRRTKLHRVVEEEGDSKKRELDIIDKLVEENKAYRQDLEEQQKSHREQIDKLIESNRRKCTVM